MNAAAAEFQTAMRRLAGVLSLVCLVLFLLAIEQKHTVAIWTILRDETVAMAGRARDWAVRLPSATADSFAGPKARPERRAVRPPAAAESDMTLAGEFGPADPVTRAAAGFLVVAGAELRLGNGDVLGTRPLRIAAGDDIFAPGRTFAARLNAPDDAQIELRQVIAAGDARPAPPVKLCDDQPAGVVALLHRRGRVDLMLFRAGTAGPAAPIGRLCGVWSFAER